MKTIALVNTEECPCYGTHNPACMEFIQGFRDFGYETSEVKILEDCKGKDILVLSSHKIDWNHLNIMNEIAPDAVYILWFYFEYLDKIPFKKYIITGEQYYYPPKLEGHLKLYNIGMSIRNYQPLLLRANEAPEKIGTYEKNIVRDGCFIGTPYKSDWGHSMKNSLYHSIWNGLLTSDQRRDLYLSSKICFGFHADANIDNSHVTQRVFEGLAYGCVVISDNPAARDMTGGIVEYAENFEKFCEIFEFYKTHDKEREEKISAGYKWAKQYGTNRHAAKMFLDKIDELWA
jgi:spore maturation protein CgeB